MKFIVLSREAVNVWDNHVILIEFNLIPILSEGNTYEYMCQILTEYPIELTEDILEYINYNFCAKVNEGRLTYEFGGHLIYNLYPPVEDDGEIYISQYGHLWIYVRDFHCLQ